MVERVIGMIETSQNKKILTEFVKLIANTLRELETCKVGGVWMPEEDNMPYIHYDWKSDKDEVTLGQVCEDEVY